MVLICEHGAVVDEEFATLAAGLAAATAYEAIGKRGDVGPGIGTIVPGRRMFGPAYTVRCLIGDARAVWHGLAEAPAGSVLVIDIGGTAAATAIGATSVQVALRRGLAGVVTNAAVRDVAEIRALGLPVFAAGVSVRGTLKAHPGELGVPVALGSAVVTPGDLVVGDDDGLVVVPQTLLPELPALVRRQQAREREIDRRIAAGEDPRVVLGL